MSLLQGRQFFVWELFPVIDAAIAAAPMDIYLLALRADANTRYEADSRADDPTSYTSISPFWQAADGVLSEYASIPAVAAAAQALPVDEKAPQRSTKMLAAGLLLLAGAGALYVYSQHQGRR